MKAIIVSFIDSSNIGDRLIAETLSDQLLTDIETKKYSYKLIEESQIKRNNQLIRRSKIHDYYYKYFRQLPFVKDLVSKGKWLRSRKRMYEPANIRAFEAALEETDLLIIGGGNAIFDLSPATLSAQRFDQVVTLANKHHTKIFVSSIGIGPFCTKKQQQAAIATLNKCDAVTFRDQRSYAYLQNAQHSAAYASVDPVFLLPEKQSFEELGKQREPHQKIGICVIDYRITGCPQKEYLQYLEEMSHLIRELVSSKREIVLFSSEIQDYETVESVYSEFRECSQVQLIVITDKEELLELYQGLSLIIGTRMHSMIVAVSQFVPIIGLSWQQKVVEMFKNLEMEEDVLPIEELPKKRVLLFEKVNEKLVENHEASQQMKRAKEKMRHAFAINHELMDDFRQGLVE